ncbi:MAG TPA: cobalt ECF transporter T component CbiQ [Symbiobacteriaceae bacterium]
MTRLFTAASPLAKVAFLLALIVAASLLRHWQLLLLVIATGLLLVRAAGMAPGTVLRRLLWLVYLSGGLLLTLPLVLPGQPALQVQVGSLQVTGSWEGLRLAGLLSLRMLGCFLPALSLTASTPLPELLEALSRLGVPRLFTVLAGMAIRYVSVLQDEARRMNISRASRGYRPSRAFWNRQTLATSAQTLGMLLLRAYDRSERIYWAMLSRGYSVRRPPAARPLSGRERWAVAGAVAVTVALVLLDCRLNGGG